MLSPTQSTCLSFALICSHYFIVMGNAGPSKYELGLLSDSPATKLSFFVTSYQEEGDALEAAVDILLHKNIRHYSEQQVLTYYIQQYKPVADQQIELSSSMELKKFNSSSAILHTDREPTCQSWDIMAAKIKAHALKYKFYDVLAALLPKEEVIPILKENGAYLQAAKMGDMKSWFHYLVKFRLSEWNYTLSIWTDDLPSALQPANFSTQMLLSSCEEEKVYYNDFAAKFIAKHYYAKCDASNVAWVFAPCLWQDCPVDRPSMKKLVEMGVKMKTIFSKSEIALLQSKGFDVAMD